MKKILFLVGLFWGAFWFSQSVTLSRAVKIHENNDRLFHYLPTVGEGAEYLGDVEVQGASTDDAAIFGLVYQKAKSIGANAFSVKRNEAIDGGWVDFNPQHYVLSLYYVAEIPTEDNMVYLFASSKKQKVRINEKEVLLAPRTYLGFRLDSASTTAVSSGRFLGSKIVLGYKEGQPSRYFQVQGGGLRSDRTGGSGGLLIKSGDLILLERSYGGFLRAIYAEKAWD
ncbi:hypothetical protein [Bergeyella sp. RCAD1439]|uniref:hypothetical protein n=1 Tax=Bergeyella anatis TaxID=3113737 RepID=UPI002E19A52A|nr:hypothetical protein [Bergeyella sp. RCAD1439]